MAYKADDPVGNWEWKSPVIMSREFSRFHFTVTAADCRQVRTITEEEARAAGIVVPITKEGHPLLRLTGKFPPCDYMEVDPISGRASSADYFRAHFASAFDARAKPGQTWADNSCVWLVRVEVKR